MVVFALVVSRCVVCLFVYVVWLTSLNYIVFNGSCLERKVFDITINELI